MPYVEIGGVLKKVACGPCIRGHRSTKCDHLDRLMVEVRKPGRPLSSCPHPPGSCTCSRVVINYAIPKNAACPSTSGAAAASASVPQTPTNGAGTNRVSKPRQKRSSISVNVAALEKAIKTDDADANLAASADSSVANTSSSDTSPISSHTSSGENENIPRRRLSFSSSESTERRQSTTPGATVNEFKGAQGQANGTTFVKTEGGCCGPKAQVQSPPKPAVKSCCSGKNDDAPPIGFAGEFKPSPQQALPISNPMYSRGAVPDAFVYSRASQTPSTAAMPAPSYFDFHSTNLYHQNVRSSMPAVHIPSAKDPVRAMDHDCNCGDGCACLGCAAHPHNKTTTDYILKMNEYMMGPSHTNFAPPNPAMLNRFVQDGVQTFPYNGQIDLMTGSGAYGRPHMPIVAPNPHGHTAFGYPHQQVGHGQWPLSLGQPHSQATPTQEMEKLYMYNERGQLATANGESNAATSSHGFDPISAAGGYKETDYDQSAGQSPEGNSPVLSPSSFYLQTLELPGCTDTSGTCQCGDGCDCVGCLTHGGHNGIPLGLVPENEGQSNQIGIHTPQSTGAFQETTYMPTPIENGHSGFPTAQPTSTYHNGRPFMTSVQPAQGNHAPLANQFPLPAFTSGPG